MQDFVVRRAYHNNRVIGILTVILFLCFLLKIAANWAMLRSSISTCRAVILLLLLFLSYVLFRVLHTLLHELGHILFGKMMGFRLTSVQLNRYLFAPGKRTIHNLGRENIRYLTSMRPGEKDKAYKYVIYSLGGCLITAIALLCISAAGILKEPGTPGIMIKYIFFYEGTVSIIRNIVPNYHGEYGNDGFNAYCLGRYQAMRQSYYYQCILYRDFLSGKSPYNVTLGTDVIDAIKDNYNIYSYYPSVYLYYKCIDSNRLKEAEECLKMIKEHETIFGQQTISKIRLEELYYRCMAEKDFQITKEELDRLKAMAQKGSIEVIRVYHAICKYVLRDYHTSMEYEREVKKVIPDYMQGLYHFQQRLIMKSDLYKQRFAALNAEQ